ncbi:dITP/XTP pyrophosphatase [uncultured Gammaproteobacteria bacterium]
MSRHFTGDALVIATHNPGKVREIGALLAPYAATFHAAGELGLPEPEETGDSFIANAMIKALAAAAGSGLPALADDSGLAVTALGGRPGIHSARWAGPQKDFTVAMKLVEQALAGQTDRSAHFACALVLAWPDGYCEAVEGRVDGDLVWPPRGGNGFGYDPIFVARGHSLTFAEIAAEAKHAISHRADAFRQLVQCCFT